ncbi:MAG: hypothetical protein BroJett026_16040 [Betaproteobacteria bacterium]|nr:MAG: hypothetical protein BroJett026_16040 [Betaproteobacteria bacterium]
MDSIVASLTRTSLAAHAARDREPACTFRTDVPRREPERAAVFATASVAHAYSQRLTDRQYARNRGPNLSASARSSGRIWDRFM